MRDYGYWLHFKVFYKFMKSLAIELASTLEIDKFIYSSTIIWLKFQGWIESTSPNCVETNANFWQYLFQKSIQVLMVKSRERCKL